MILASAIHSKHYVATKSVLITLLTSMIVGLELNEKGLVSTKVESTLLSTPTTATTTILLPLLLLLLLLPTTI